MGQKRLYLFRLDELVIIATVSPNLKVLRSKAAEKGRLAVIASPLHHAVVVAKIKSYL